MFGEMYWHLTLCLDCHRCAYTNLVIGLGAFNHQYVNRCQFTGAKMLKTTGSTCYMPRLCLETTIEYRGSHSLNRIYSGLIACTTFHPSTDTWAVCPFGYCELMLLWMVCCFCLGERQMRPKEDLSAVTSQPLEVTLFRTLVFQAARNVEAGGSGVGWGNWELWNCSLWVAAARRTLSTSLLAQTCLLKEAPMAESPGFWIPSWGVVHRQKSRSGTLSQWFQDLGLNYLPRNQGDLGQLPRNPRNLVKEDE